MLRQQRRQQQRLERVLRCWVVWEKNYAVQRAVAKLASTRFMVGIILTYAIRNHRSDRRKGTSEDCSPEAMASSFAAELDNVAELAQFIAEVFADDPSKDQPPAPVLRNHRPTPAPWAQDFCRTFSRVSRLNPLIKPMKS